MNDSYQHPGKWQDVTLVPTMGRSEANHFVMSHIVRGLERNSVYEAIIHAKNRYGWNEVSEEVIFQIFLNPDCFIIYQALQELIVGGR